MKAMLGLARRVEEEIRRRSKIRGFITPFYEGYCLSNVPATILAHFGIDSGRRPLPRSLIDRHMGEAKKLVLLLIDSLGFRQLYGEVQRSPRLALADLIRSGVSFPITSTFPSTTSTALTTLNTGLTPQEHGVIGYTMYLKEFGLVANMVGFTPAAERRKELLLEMGLDLKGFLGSPTVYETLAERGVKSYVITRNFYRNSCLSRMLHSGSNVQTYVNSPDLFVTMRKVLESNREEPAFIFAYWDALDSVSHTYGPFTEEASAELRGFSFSLKAELIDRLEPSVSRGTALMVTGDHGQSAVSKENSIIASQYPRLMERLRIPPTGDSRAAFLYVKPGEHDRVRRYVKREFRGRAQVLDSEEALRMGLFGSGRAKPELLDRIGDLILLPKEGYNIIYPYKRQEGDFALKGFHGGLSEDEALVPFICTRLLPPT